MHSIPIHPPPKWVGWWIYSTVTTLSINFLLSPLWCLLVSLLWVVNPRVMEQVLYHCSCKFFLSLISCQEEPLPHPTPSIIWPAKGKEAGRQREEDGEGGEEGKQERERETEREHVMVKCFEVLNSAAAAPANHTIAAVVAATATAVANTHFKNVCIKLWTKSTPWNFHWIHSVKIFFFLLEAKPRIYP